MQLGKMQIYQDPKTKTRLPLSGTLHHPRDLKGFTKVENEEEEEEGECKVQEKEDGN
jgi:hypothetical protein